MIFQQFTHFCKFTVVLLCFSVLTNCVSPTPGGDNDDAEAEIYFSGRIDHTQESGPVIVWQGSEIAIEYQGKMQSVTFQNVTGSAYFDVTLDGSRIGMIEARTGEVDLSSLLQNHEDADWQTLKLLKRSEASVGHAGFSHFTVEGSTRTHTPVPPAYKFVFFGDSITAGSCSEDGSTDQWDDFSTHNALVSYAALTAEQLNAEYHNVSASGVGISAGYQTYTAPQVWNRLYPDVSAQQADLSAFQPDVVFINYGENDDSYTSGQNASFPNDFTSRYVALLKDIRQAYPESAIVILRGGMWGGSQSQRLRGPWENVVSQFTQQDDNAYSFVFNHWSSLHPRTTDHEIMAQELVDWLERTVL